ncbi:Baculoviral IAP repeat-containing protein 3 [Lamellibrachia satsuma]|nr:Baculoviral IAP repeat-containing protein 3 [Lamellibrachia satsuma]
MVIGPAFKKNDDMQHGEVLLDTTKATADSTQTEPRMDTYFSRRIKGPPFERKEEMQYEGVRLETFKNWPNWAAVWPTLLAKAGFYYTKTADQVACFSCSGRLKTWEAGDSPLTEHKRFFPQCRFVTGRDSSNVPLGGMIETPEVPPGGQNNHTRNVPPGEACNEPVGHQSGRRGDYYRNLATRSAQRDGSTSLTRLTTEINQQYPRGQYESLPSSARRDRPAHCIPRMLTGGTPLRTDRNLSTLAMKLESKRLESFTDWPTRSYARPEKLAKAGLYYLGIADRVKCAFCNGILRNWEPRDEPKIEHRKLFPNCAFLRDARAVGNVTIEEERVNIQQTSQNDAANPSPSSEMGVITERPAHQKYAVEATRLSTFRRWPRSSSILPEDLAVAGFFYKGPGDNVKCFFCDGGLRNFEFGDDPWTEHARWFPRCNYVKTVKGEEFICVVQSAYTGQSNATSTSVKTTATTRPGKAGARRSPVEPRAVRARMDTSAVLSVLAMGFSRELVYNAIEHRLATTGDDFPNVQSLVDAVFAAQEAAPSSSSSQIQQNNSVAAAATERSNSTAAETAAAAGNATKENVSSNEVTRNPTDETRLRCKICLDGEANVLFLPCGHLCSCARCAPALRNCAICRALIRGTVRVYVT